MNFGGGFGIGPGQLQRVIEVHCAGALGNRYTVTTTGRKFICEARVSTLDNGQFSGEVAKLIRQMNWVVYHGLWRCPDCKQRIDEGYGK